MKAKKIKFLLNGCDIYFIAEAPEDITLRQLLKQCDRIVPNWCACGIHSLDENTKDKTDVFIDYDDIKADPDANCRIKEQENVILKEN